MGDSTDKKGFRAYWRRVIMRSTMDAKRAADGLGIGPVKLLASFILTMIACIYGFSFLGQSIAERILWALGGLVAGLGGFLFVFMFFLVRAPWKFENELAIVQQAQGEVLLDQMKELRQLVKAEQDFHASFKEASEKKIAELIAENKRTVSLDIHGNLLRSQINKFVKGYEVALSLLRDLKESGAHQLAQLDQNLSEYLPQRIPQYHGFFSECEQYGCYFTFDEDDPEPKLGAPEGQVCIKTCSDRLEKLADILSVIS